MPRRQLGALRAEQEYRVAADPPANVLRYEGGWQDPARSGGNYLTASASSDGILVVDENQAIVSYHQCLLELWGIPAALLAQRDDQQIRAYAASRCADPQGFLERLRDRYQHPLETGREEIRLKDGRVFDRYTAPVIAPDGNYFGRVWFTPPIVSSPLV